MYGFYALCPPIWDDLSSCVAPFSRFSPVKRLLRPNRERNFTDRTLEFLFLFQRLIIDEQVQLEEAVLRVYTLCGDTEPTEE